MTTQNDKITCDSCGKDRVRIIHGSKSYGSGENHLVIENVPLISCPHCGESYVTAKTLRAIENVKIDHKNTAVERPVPVAVMA
ncbi:MAG: YgiT-type zinc finger protein [Pyrinomonadaceae bacterium]